MSRIKLDLTGKKFGRLLAIRPTDKRSDKKVVWEFLCECGKTHYTTATSVKSGRAQSCGCLATDNLIRRSMKHGYTRQNCKRPRSYHIWTGMIARCTHSWHKNWDRYGGRGISVCDRWRDYTNFLNDMGEPDVSMTLERINNSKNYEPTNCKWATRIEQAQNTSRNVYIEYNNKRQTISAWARELKIQYMLLYRELKKGIPLSEIEKVGCYK